MNSNPTRKFTQHAHGAHVIWAHGDRIDSVGVISPCNLTCSPQSPDRHAAIFALEIFFSRHKNYFMDVDNHDTHGFRRTLAYFGLKGWRKSCDFCLRVGETDQACKGFRAIIVTCTRSGHENPLFLKNLMFALSSNIIHICFCFRGFCRAAFSPWSCAKSFTVKETNLFGLMQHSLPPPVLAFEKVTKVAGGSRKEKDEWMSRFGLGNEFLNPVNLFVCMERRMGNQQELIISR